MPVGNMKKEIKYRWAQKGDRQHKELYMPYSVCQQNRYVRFAIVTKAVVENITALCLCS